MKLLISSVIIIFSICFFPNLFFGQDIIDENNDFVNSGEETNYITIGQQLDHILNLYENNKIDVDSLFTLFLEIMNIDVDNETEESINQTFISLMLEYNNKGNEDNGITKVMENLVKMADIFKQRKINERESYVSVEKTIEKEKQKEVEKNNEFQEPEKSGQSNTIISAIGDLEINRNSLEKTIEKEKQKEVEKNNEFQKPEKSGQSNTITSAIGDLEISYNIEVKKEVKPGRIVTFPIIIKNNGDGEIVYINNLKLPYGWRAITDEKENSINKNERKLELLSVFIPIEIFAGEYNVEYIVIDKRYPQKVNVVSIPITILPIINLNVVSMNIENKSIIAGNDIDATFLISNSSNSGVKIKINAQSNLYYDVELKKKQIFLKPNEKKTIYIKVKTNKDIKKKINHNMTFSCKIINNRNITATATHQTEIIPLVSNISARYEKVPIRFKATYVNSYDNGYKQGLQGELTGNFKLIKDKNVAVDFVFRNPGVWDKSTFGRRERNFISIKSPNFYLLIGDKNYSLSPLTAMSIYGTGIKSEMKFGKFELGSWYYHNNKYETQNNDSKKYASYLNYNISPKYNLGIKYFKNEKYSTNGNVVSFSGKLKPITNTSLEVEYAMNNQDDSYQDAFYLSTNGYYTKWNYSLKYIYADSLYKGYNKDKRYISTNINWNVLKNWRVFANIHKGKYNREFGINNEYSYLSDYYTSGVKFHNSKINIDVNYNYINKKNIASSINYDQIENKINMNVGQRFGKINYNLSMNYGYGKDLLTDKVSSLNRYKFFVGYMLSDRQSYNLYLSYNGYDYLSGEIRQYVNLGLYTHYKLFINTHISANYNTFQYLDETNYDYHSMNFNISQRLFNNHIISLRSRYYLHEDPNKNNMFDMVVDYSLPINVPIHKKKNVGEMYGQIVNAKTGKPIENIIISINGASTVTDKKGIYKFKYLSIGQYFFNINTINIGENLIPINYSYPKIIKIVNGERKRLDIKLTKALSFSGKVVVYKEVERGALTVSNKAEYRVDYPLSNSIVELKRGGELKKVITNHNGVFKFTELVSGEWTLSVRENDIPKGYYSNKKHYSIDVQSQNKSKIFEIKVLPKSRKINIIEDGGEIIQ
ncbi:MAG: hypothetical protein U9N76_06810 [Candidatus Marinimicrobia bacterium]|nr:hypothetical protein [Candidatus Neomarinimicrobiota bacterium]